MYLFNCECSTAPPIPNRYTEHYNTSVKFCFPTPLLVSQFLGLVRALFRCACSTNQKWDLTTFHARVKNLDPLKFMWACKSKIAPRSQTHNLPSAVYCEKVEADIDSKHVIVSTRSFVRKLCIRAHPSVNLFLYTFKCKLVV